MFTFWVRSDGASRLHHAFQLDSDVCIVGELKEEAEQTKTHCIRSCVMFGACGVFCIFQVGSDGNVHNAAKSSF